MTSLPYDALKRQFQDPPAPAKPHVWWHWMAGDITPEGIRLDLEWMHRIGIGGVHKFDAFWSPQRFVKSPLRFGSPEWRDAVRDAASRADALGLDFGIACSPGWSESGGPWVAPADAMKKLVWSETRVRGGQRCARVLPHPPRTVGPFQNFPISRAAPMLGHLPPQPIPEIYRDVAVVAYRLPAGDETMCNLQPEVTSSAGAVEASVLWDDDFNTGVDLPVVAEQPGWILLDLGRSRRLHSVTLALQRPGGAQTLVNPDRIVAELQSSDDGAAFSSVAVARDTTDVQQTLRFEPCSARFFRLLVLAPTASPVIAGLASDDSARIRVAALVLHAVPRIDRFERKAGFFVDAGPPERSCSVFDDELAIRAEDIEDLTSLLQADGALDWTPPEGDWAVLRIGYSLLGTPNRPTVQEATGLEVDKLDANAVRRYIEHYLSFYSSILDPQGTARRSLRSVMCDSWQAGAQNWTECLPEEFARRRGYELRKWMPALTGRIIDSTRAAERFLWDFRRTLGELLAENHYAQIAELLRARGITCYAESHEQGRAFIGDGMDAKRTCDVPTGAMWVGNFRQPGQCDVDLLESASAAHLYGQQLVASESMTALAVPGAGRAYAFSPESLKPAADRQLAQGVNRFILHSCVHQPLVDQVPGLTLGPVGIWFNRNETWAGQAGAWIDYLARSSFLMQQGRFVADILYFYGQDSNLTALYSQSSGLIPEGFAFDFASAHALTMISVRDGFLTTPGGMRYRLLVLDPRTRVMSLDVLRRIGELARAGATVLGERPVSTPSLEDDEAAFDALADEIWGPGRVGQTRYGEGRVIRGRSVAEVLNELAIAPDFSCCTEVAGPSLRYVHRQAGDVELYFISNPSPQAARIDGRFRVRGKVAEIWRADTASTSPAASYPKEDHTVVPLDLQPHDALFVVFRKAAEERSERENSAASIVFRHGLQGPWRVCFQPGRGAPESTVFETLECWTRHVDPRIRYFSGTARYETSLQLTREAFGANRRIELDLGRVANLAEVFVNERSAGVVWKSPFRLEVSRWLVPGRNELVIAVTNLWPNRLIGDRQPGVQPITFTTFNPYEADSLLLESGLLGPVTLSCLEERR